MIEFPLILIGYALLPLILSAMSRTAAFPGTFRIPAACLGTRSSRSSPSTGAPNDLSQFA